MKLLLVIPFVLLFFFSCKNKSADKEKTPEVVAPDTAIAAPNTAYRDSQLLKLTSEILTLIKNKEYRSLAAFIHPATGLRFSPYGYIDTTSDLVISPDKLIAEAGSKKQARMEWGEMDGSGDPIKLTLNEYMKRFVYDVDFIAPDSLKVNHFLGGGNSMNNLSVVYDSCDFTESHFPGFNKELGGMDWRSLRLVFKMIDGKYYLVGIVHDEWTI